MLNFFNKPNKSTFVLELLADLFAGQIGSKMNPQQLNSRLSFKLYLLVHDLFGIPDSTFLIFQYFLVSAHTLRRNQFVNQLFGFCVHINGFELLLLSRIFDGSDPVDQTINFDGRVIFNTGCILPRYQNLSDSFPDVDELLILFLEFQNLFGSIAIF